MPPPRQRSGETPDMGPAADMIAAYLDHLVMTDRSQDTIDARRGTLHRADRALPHGLDQASPDELQRWLAGAPSASSRATYRSALTAFYRWACRPHDRWLEVDPMTYLDKARHPEHPPPDPCTDDQLAEALARCTEVYRPWFTLAAYAGLRCIELSRLDREHVNPDGVHVLGKGGKRRTVPTHPLVWEVVQSLPPGPICRRMDGARCTANNVTARGRRHLVDTLGMADMHMHRFRHWFGTRSLEVIGDIRVVQVLMGHSSVATTQRYTLVSAGRRTEAVSGLPNLDGLRAASAPAGLPAAAPPLPAAPRPRGAHPGRR